MEVLTAGRLLRRALEARPRRQPGTCLERRHGGEFTAGVVAGMAAESLGRAGGVPLTGPIRAIAGGPGPAGRPPAPGRMRPGPHGDGTVPMGAIPFRPRLPGGDPRHWASGAGTPGPAPGRLLGRPRGSPGGPSPRPRGAGDGATNSGLERRPTSSWHEKSTSYGHAQRGPGNRPSPGTPVGRPAHATRAFQPKPPPRGDFFCPENFSRAQTIARISGRKKRNPSNRAKFWPPPLTAKVRREPNSRYFLLSAGAYNFFHREGRLSLRPWAQAARGRSKGRRPSPQN
jgi:hypothetical protein